MNDTPTAPPTTCHHCALGNVPVMGVSGRMWHVFDQMAGELEPCEEELCVEQATGTRGCDRPKLQIVRPRHVGIVLTKANGEHITAVRECTEKLQPGAHWLACLCYEIDPADIPCVVCEIRFEWEYTNVLTNKLDKPPSAC